MQHLSISLTIIQHPTVSHTTFPPFEMQNVDIPSVKTLQPGADWYANKYMLSSPKHLLHM